MEKVSKMYSIKDASKGDVFEFTDMVVAKKTQLVYYTNVPLFLRNERDSYVLYKPVGMSIGFGIGDERILPNDLYIRRSDRVEGLQEAQVGFNVELKTALDRKDPKLVKKVLRTLMEESFSQSQNSEILEGIGETMDIILDEFVNDSEVMSQLVSVSDKDHTTVTHSVNMVPFSLCYGSYIGMSRKELKEIGLSALLHDVGKTDVATKILKADRKLTEEEFSDMRKHPLIGYTALNRCHFEYRGVAVVALQHHEKLDGSGYPDGATRFQISDLSKIICVIDCYEALTNDDRPYRNSIEGLEALKTIKRDVLDGKYDNDVFCNFVSSLMGMPLER